MGTRFSEKGKEKIEKMDGKDVVKLNVSDITERFEAFCPLFNSVTSIGPKVIINKLETTEPYKIIERAINEKLIGERFTTKDIIRATNATNLTNGTLQNKMLSCMVCNGIIAKKIIKENKEGKPLKKPRYEFEERRDKRPCAEIIEKDSKKKCGFNWSLAEHSQYWQK